MQRPSSLKAVIFALACLLYLLALLLYKNDRDLADAQLRRYVQKESLVANLSRINEPINQILSAGDKNLELAQALAAESIKKGSDPWIVIARMARVFNSELARSEAEWLAKTIVSKARKYRIDPLLMAALVSQESAFYEYARSPVGAYGYGQLMPDTARYLGVDPEIPEENLEGCAKYLREGFDTWRGRPGIEELVLASYNAGPGAVAQYGGVPPYQETETYVLIVTARYKTLKEAARQQS